MGTCKACFRTGPEISEVIGYCYHCIKRHWDGIGPEIDALHQETRERFGLPAVPPKATHGIPCNLCFRKCRIPEGATGYCGVRRNLDGRLTGGGPESGLVSFYHDPLPTNCVAEWCCPGGSGAGYPEFALKQGPERGYRNLAVFYEACNFNCLYCQNWHFKYRSLDKGNVSSDTLAAAVDDTTTCICYFGGDPTPQLPHAISTARKALRKKIQERPLRICWETNGAMDPKILHELIKLSLKSGGCLKFDLKAWSDPVHLALTGASNRSTLENFKMVSSYIHERPDVPLLVASTLLVPGYMDHQEVYDLARFIADLDPGIPYALLAFYPQFVLTDLSTTSRSQALRCLEAAKAAGLTNVRLGNLHLLT